MKNALLWIGAIIIAYVVWHLLLGLLSGVLHFAVWLGCILLFCWLVSAVYKAMTKQKQVY